MKYNYNANYKRTKTTKFLHDICKFVHILGLPNFWFQDLDMPKCFKHFDTVNKIGNLCVYILVFSEHCSFITQKNLSESQQSNQYMFSIANTLVTGYFVWLTHQKVEVTEIIWKVGVQLKNFNDEEAEKYLIKKTMIFSGALVVSCFLAAIDFTIEAILTVISDDATFVIVITAWPDIDDRSTFANTLRALYYIFWCIYIFRTCAAYTLVICLTVCLEQLYQNLNSYFCSLNKIFEKDLTQTEKEHEYEEGFKLGIELHSETLKCLKQVQKVCGYVFSGQIIFNVIIIIIMMCQIANAPRNFSTSIRILITLFTILCSTGFFMWSAGDITIEAEKLPIAMYSSGWENCYNASSARLRKLVVIAINQAQKPIILTGLGLVQLSYESYVTIVKSSYSVFSVLY